MSAISAAIEPEYVSTNGLICLPTSDATASRMIASACAFLSWSITVPSGVCFFAGAKIKALRCAVERAHFSNSCAAFRSARSPCVTGVKLAYRTPEGIRKNQENFR